MPSDADQSGTRRLHPLTLAFSTWSAARNLLAPAIIGGLSVGDGDVGGAFRWVLAIMFIPAILIAVARYLSFRFSLGDDLVIDSGLLARQHRVIPLARIQNIEVRQNALQRAFGVAELRVETAGGGRGTEAVISVIRHAEADELRGELLARRRGAETARGDSVLAAPPVVQLARLRAEDLAIAGATANEVGFIAAALFSLLEMLDDFADRIPASLRDRASTLDNAPGGALLAIALAIVAVFVLGWIVSILGSIVGYHGFTLELAGTELRKRYGLLGRREATIPLARVQAVRVEESLLRRPLGLASLKIETAGWSPGERQRGGAEAFLPLARRKDVARLVAGVFGDLDFDSVNVTRVHPRSRHRSFMRYAMVIVIPSALLFLPMGVTSLWFLALLPFAFGLAHWQYLHRGYALTEGYMFARNGVFNRVTSIVPRPKIQTLHLREAPSQRRHGLATLVVDTAAGGRAARVRDLARGDAESLLHDLATAKARAM